MPASSIAKRIAAKSATAEGPRPRTRTRAGVSECAKLKAKEDRLRERREALERKNAELRKEAERRLKERQEAERKRLEAQHKAEDDKLAKRHEKEYAAMVLKFGCTPKPRRRRRKGKAGEPSQGPPAPAGPMPASPPRRNGKKAGKRGGKRSAPTQPVDTLMLPSTPGSDRDLEYGPFDKPTRIVGAGVDLLLPPGERVSLSPRRSGRDAWWWEVAKPLPPLPTQAPLNLSPELFPAGVPHMG
jgi:hypothetical protein